MSNLYRGVSKSDDDKNCGKLKPRGDKSKVAIRYNDGSRYGQVTYGESEINTVRAHQLESGRYGGCCISTTRSFEKAKHFATSGNIEDGYVYVIDESLLVGLGVEATEFRDSEYPQEMEVTLKAKDCNEIPLDVVIEKIEVKCTY